MVWGTLNISVPIGGCPLHTEFLWGHVFHTDPTGTFDYSRVWPASADGAFYMQVGTIHVDALGVLTMQSSNSILASCL